MENRNSLLIAAGIFLLLALVFVSIIGFELYSFYFPKSVTPANLNQAAVNANVNAGFLPTTPESTTTAERLAALEKLEKEKKFISSYWLEPEMKFTAKVAPYRLPLDKIKEQVANYRDFSRKVKIDSALPKLTSNGFVVIDNFYAANSNDWETSYKLISKSKVPIFLTADSVTGLYQDTLHIVYREIEVDIFYPSLWELLKQIFDQVNQRYRFARQQIGIENDTITEANRLELAYLSVALKLLQPQAGQIRESLAGDKKFFSPQEAALYSLTVPAELTDEVSQEIKLISAQAKTAKSPIFLYEKSYSDYQIPEYYRSSEKLKNYYLAKTWLADILFPLWNQSNDCSGCLLDEEDHAINFLTGLYLTSDLASSQNLKNRWANIYKSTAFFRGTEANLTYLYYDDALRNLFGKNYDLDKIFTDNFEGIKEKIKKLQEKINAYSFPLVLSGSAETKEMKGLRLLRQHYLFEDKLFESLAGAKVGPYLKPETEARNLPFTACPQEKNIARCFPTALDLFNFLGNLTAKKIMEKSGDSLYQNYEKNLADFADHFKNFDRPTWHENAYLSLLWADNYLNRQEYSGYPAFMQNDAWAKKALNASLGGWVDFHREINFEKIKLEEDNEALPEFPYGYIEPQPEFYAQLLANVDMIIQGFTALQIIETQSNTFERLSNLKLVLQKLIQLSQKELENSALSDEDYKYLNNFYRQIRLITGDIKREDIQNRYSFTYAANDRDNLSESVNGLDLIVAVYPGKEGKLLFALGPVFAYAEGKNRERSVWAWQADYR